MPLLRTLSTLPACGWLSRWMQRRKHERVRARAPSDCTLRMMEDTTSSADVFLSTTLGCIFTSIKTKSVYVRPHNESVYARKSGSAALIGWPSDSMVSNGNLVADILKERGVRVSATTRTVTNAQLTHVCSKIMRQTNPSRYPATRATGRRYHGCTVCCCVITESSNPPSCERGNNPATDEY